MVPDPSRRSRLLRSRACSSARANSWSVNGLPRKSRLQRALFRAVDRERGAPEGDAQAV